jgi:DNA-binding XRE family transcriptional regulator
VVVICFIRKLLPCVKRKEYESFENTSKLPLDAVLRMAQCSLGMAKSKRTGLREARLKRNQTLTDVADAIGVDVSSLSRIERGDQLPTRAVARKLFDHFCGSVELGAIYDPEHRAVS